MKPSGLPINVNVPGPLAFNKWLAGIGVSNVTGWRWRRNGWLRTLNIAGRVYISADAIREFTERAASGEFAQKHKTPKRLSKGVHLEHDALDSAVPARPARLSTASQ